jgi:hypothetical protein
LALALAACGTRYQEMGFTEGVTAQQVTVDTYRIIARGNGATSCDDSELCVAEGCRDDQGDWSVSRLSSALQTHSPEAHMTLFSRSV